MTGHASSNSAAVVRGESSSKSPGRPPDAAAAQWTDEAMAHQGHATRNSVREIGQTFVCENCRHYATALTPVHQMTGWCTGCLLRELRPFDYTVRNA